MHLTGYDKLGIFSEAVLSEPVLLEPGPAVNKKTFKSKKFCLNC